MSASQPAGEPITLQGLEDLKAELDTLETDGRHEMSKQIQAARELGDLKENAEYHIAKDNQAHLETKIKRLRERLRSAVVVDPSSDDHAFAFGRTAEVLDEASGRTHVWTIVGPTESNVGEGRLSAESAVARALLDRAPGETVAVDTPGGTRCYRIERLLP